MFLHEHPEWATSWKEGCITELMARPGVLEVRADMCAFGMKLRECIDGELVKKGTRFLTNAPQIAVELEHRCNGNHKHLRLEGGDKCKRAQVYPDELCRAVCRGAAREKEYRDQGLYCLGAVDVCGEIELPRYGGEHEEDDTSMGEILEIANSWGGGH